MISPIELAAAKVGGITKLARELNVKHQTFYSWKRVPAERVLDMERITGVPRHELRPDLYPAPDAETVAAAVGAVTAIPEGGVA